MKLLTFILSFLVIALSFMPCCDSFARTTAQEIPTISQSASGDHTHAPDDCSPFCQCSCCAGFSFYFHPLVLSEAIGATRSVPYSLFCISQLQQRPLPIWQPPQLV